jgi:hypothetical protein
MARGWKRDDRGSKASEPSPFVHNVGRAGEGDPVILAPDDPERAAFSLYADLAADQVV